MTADRTAIQARANDARRNTIAPGSRLFLFRVAAQGLEMFLELTSGWHPPLPSDQQPGLFRIARGAGLSRADLLGLYGLAFLQSGETETFVQEVVGYPVFPDLSTLDAWMLATSPTPKQPYVPV